MSNQRVKLLRTLCLCVAVQASAKGGTTPIGPSDCHARDADSTCASAVAAAPPPSLPIAAASVLYDGPLGGVPASGYAYWGVDFVAELTGTSSPVRHDEFINRSAVPVTVTLSFDLPPGVACHAGCMPRVEFEVDIGWFKLDPPVVATGNTASVSQTFAPGRGYGWVIGLWQAKNTRLTVSVPTGSTASLADVGLSPFPAVANEIPAVIGTCACWSGIPVACSDGTRFSNGLLGVWNLEMGNYVRAGAFNDCPPDH